MQYRKLPKGTEEISVIGLGSSAIGEAGDCLLYTSQIAGAIALAVFVMDSAFRLFQGHGKVEQSCRSHGNTGRPDWIDGLPEEHQRD